MNDVPVVLGGTKQDVVRQAEADKKESNLTRLMNVSGVVLILNVIILIVIIVLAVVMVNG